MNFRKSLSVFLFILFSVGSIPDQVVHLFAGHRDSVDSVNVPASIDHTHIHCAALQYELGNFEMSEPVNDPGQPVVFISTFLSYSLSYFMESAEACNSDRAPPALV